MTATKASFSGEKAMNVAVTKKFTLIISHFLRKNWWQIKYDIIIKNLPLISDSVTQKVSNIHSCIKNSNKLQNIKKNFFDAKVSAVLRHSMVDGLQWWRHSVVEGIGGGGFWCIWGYNHG